jgi:two-component system, LytTR family, sensor kinase
VAQQVIENAVIGAVVVGAVLALFIALCRFRRVHTTVDDAVLDAIQRLSKAAPELRSGLTERAADQAAKHLVELLNCVAVGIEDVSGEVVSWDGQANHHHRDMQYAIQNAKDNNRREHVNHEDLPCAQRGSCPMRSAVVVPLIVEGSIAGVLIVVGGVNSNKRLMRMANEIAGFLCTQLELAKLDESKQQLAQAEIRALRAQISPHFLYNALNTISSLIRTDPEQARELLQEFADFTRYSFRTSGLFTTLAEELRNIDRYLMIERARYDNRLNVRLKIAPEVLSVTVPFLVLQPLVENAVKHGVSVKAGGGTVTVIAQDNGNEALISVEDDGVGMDADRLFADLRDAHTTGAHVGIGNINQRMRSVFGDEYALMVETAPGLGMKVTLRVPKFHSGVRADLPDYTASEDEIPSPT